MYRPITATHTVSGVASRRPDRPPQPGPENHREDDGDRREARALAVEPRLDHVREQRFEREEHAERPADGRPAVRDRESEERRHRGRDPHAGVRNEAQHHAEQAEERRVRNADEIERDAERDAEEGVHHELHAEVVADAVRGLGHRLGHEVDAAPAR